MLLLVGIWYLSLWILLFVGVFCYCLIECLVVVDDDDDDNNTDNVNDKNRMKIDNKITNDK